MKIERANPRALLTPKRYDYLVKRRFFLHLLNGNDPDSERVYRWHIEKRTGGNEPRSPKNTVDDYVVACRELLHSVIEDGFLESGAVKIGHGNVVIGSGAHRISVCLALNCPILVRRIDKRPGKPWARDWFEKNQMSKSDLLALDRAWAELKGA